MNNTSEIDVSSGDDFSLDIFIRSPDSFLTLEEERIYIDSCILNYVTNRFFGYPDTIKTRYNINQTVLYFYDKARKMGFLSV